MTSCHHLSNDPSHCWLVQSSSFRVGTGQLLLSLPTENPRAMKCGTVATCVDVGRFPVTRVEGAQSWSMDAREPPALSRELSPRLAYVPFSTELLLAGTCRA